MALLDNLLGGGDSTKSAAAGGQVATNPGVDLHADDVLQLLHDGGPGSSLTELTGIGSLDLGVQAPVARRHSPTSSCAITSRSR